MNQISLEQRIDELEARFAFQEQALFELNDALAQSRLEYVRTHDMLSRALEELGQMRGQMAALDAAPAEEPPPHY